MDMTSLLALLIAGLTSSAALLVVAGMGDLRASAGMRRRISDYLVTGEGTPATARDLEISEPFFERVIAPILRRMRKLMCWIWPKNRVDALHSCGFT